MSRKKIELTDRVAKLTDKYLETNDTDFNALINKALKLYLLDHLKIGRASCRERVYISVAADSLKVDQSILMYRQLTST